MAEESNASAVANVTLCCNAIAQHVHSKHRCNRQKCLAKKSRAKLHKFSTTRPEDLEICLALKNMKSKQPVSNRRLTSRSAREIEAAFGCSKFEMCSDMLRMVQLKLTPQQPKRKKRAASELSTPLVEECQAALDTETSSDSGEKSNNSEFDKMMTILTTPPEDFARVTVTESSSSSQHTLPSSAPRHTQPTRRSHKEVFRQTHLSVQELLHPIHEQRKRITELSRQYYNTVCDTSLCHLLCIAGYDSEIDLKKIMSASMI